MKGIEKIETMTFTFIKKDNANHELHIEGHYDKLDKVKEIYLIVQDYFKKEKEIDRAKDS